MNTAALDRTLGFESDEESVHALTAKLLGLKAVNSEVDLIERLEKGLTIATVQSLRVRANLTDGRNLPAHCAATDLEPTRSLRATFVF